MRTVHKCYAIAAQDTQTSSETLHFLGKSRELVEELAAAEIKVNPTLRIVELQEIAPFVQALQDLIAAASALAENEESTLPTGEMFGDQKKIKPANMFLSVERSAIRDAIASAQALLPTEEGEPIERAND